MVVLLCDLSIMNCQFNSSSLSVSFKMKLQLDLNDLQCFQKFMSSNVSFFDKIMTTSFIKHQPISIYQTFTYYRHLYIYLLSLSTLLSSSFLPYRIFIFSFITRFLTTEQHITHFSIHLKANQMGAHGVILQTHFLILIG